jgi:hypothetical protein
MTDDANAKGPSLAAPYDPAAVESRWYDFWE